MTYDYEETYDPTDDMPGSAPCEKCGEESVEVIVGEDSSRQVAPERYDGRFLCIYCAWDRYGFGAVPDAERVAS